MHKAGFYSVILDEPGKRYTNAQQAEYWKSEAEDAIRSRNVPKLRNAVFKLLDLSVDSAGSSAVNTLSDLRI